MSRMQVFSNLDPLLDFKLQITDSHNCSLFEHDINRIISVGAGTKDNVNVEEKIITDGTISLERKNHNLPLVVWHNELIKLDSGLSISVLIDKATFFINKIKYGENIHYDIHFQEESQELIRQVLNYIYNNDESNFNPSSIALSNPSIITLKHYVSGKPVTEVMDYKTGEEKTKRKKRRH